MFSICTPRMKTSRILSFFPPHQQSRAMLAGALARISLRLVPRGNGEPAAEVLVNTAAIADRIRQPDPGADWTN